MTLIRVTPGIAVNGTVIEPVKAAVLELGDT